MSDTSHPERSPLLLRDQASAIEQRTLTLSLYCTLVAMIADLSFSVWTHAEIFLLSGIYSLMNTAGSALNLLAARLLNTTIDTKYEYTYWYIEPMVNLFNGLMICILCIYAFLNGLENIRSGGHRIYVDGVVLFSMFSALFSALVLAYKTMMSRKINSQLLRNDSRKWLIKFLFNFITLLGISPLLIFPHSDLELWSRYVDGFLLCGMALLLIPIPLRILFKNARDVMRVSDGNLRGEIQLILKWIEDELDIQSSSVHVFVAGRAYFVSIKILVGPGFELQRVAEQDQLRHRISTELEQVFSDPLDKFRLSILLTANPRWLR